MVWGSDFIYLFWVKLFLFGVSSQVIGKIQFFWYLNKNTLNTAEYKTQLRLEQKYTEYKTPPPPPSYSSYRSNSRLSYQNCTHLRYSSFHLFIDSTRSSPVNSNFFPLYKSSYTLKLISNLYLLAFSFNVNYVIADIPHLSKTITHYKVCNIIKFVYR